MNKEFCLFQIDKKRVIWELTQYCNYQCKHCCASSKKIDTIEELNTLRILEVLDELKDFGIKEIYFSGGEPFSRKDIFTILKKARNNGTICNISTNGSYITEDKAIELEKLNLNKIHISLDSNIEKDFNEFRGGDYFKTTIDAIKILKKHNIYVCVETIIWRRNLNKIDAIIKFLKSLKVDEVIFNWLVKDEILVENNGICVENHEFDRIVKNIQKYMRKYKSEIKISMHRHKSFLESEDICPAGEIFFYIDSRGYISPCYWVKKLDNEFTSKKNLKEASFEDIISGKEIKKFNKMKKAKMKACKAGDPAICLERNNTYFSKEPLLGVNRGKVRLKHDGIRIDI